VLGSATPSLESFANAQQNAPLTVLTLERVVSLQDYESFSRA
jgi:primosomal protein N'